MFRAALKIDPKDLHSRTGLGAILEAAHRLDEAEILYQDGLKIDKNNTFFQSGLNRVRAAKARSDEGHTQQEPRPSIPSTLAIPALSPGHDQEDQKSSATASGGEEPPLSPAHDQKHQKSNATASGGEEPALSPPHDQKHQKSSVTTSAGNDSACFVELRPPALAKRADFFLSSDASNQTQDRNQLITKIKKEFQELVDQEANLGVVQFYATRHGLLSRAQNAVVSDVAWNLEEAANEPEANVRAEKLQNVAKELPKKLAEWVRLASGATTLWPQLLEWQQQHQPSEDQKHDSNLSSQDAFVLSEVTRWVGVGSSTLPPEAVLLASIRRAAEMLLPTNTDPVQGEYVLAKSRVA
ncbi:MAG: hypothetical protein H7839_16460, partial [Magnetococcus sp. YQC-5]